MKKRKPAATQIATTVSTANVVPTATPTRLLLPPGEGAGVLVGAGVGAEVGAGVTEVSLTSTTTPENPAFVKATETWVLIVSTVAAEDDGATTVSITVAVGERLLLSVQESAVTVAPDADSILARREFEALKSAQVPAKVIVAVNVVVLGAKVGGFVGASVGVGSDVVSVVPDVVSVVPDVVPLVMDVVPVVTDVVPVVADVVPVVTDVVPVVTDVVPVVTDVVPVVADEVTVVTEVVPVVIDVVPVETVVAGGVVGTIVGAGVGGLASTATTIPESSAKEPLLT